MKWVPFTAHIKITPAPGKRFEYWRDMQKIANLAYSGLETLAPNTLSIASPGGGQYRSFSGYDSGGIGGLVYGCAVKPKIGNTPAQMQITGFYKSSAANKQPHSELERISGGDVYDGPSSHSWDSNPTATINSEVKTLKNAMENAITAALPGGITFNIYRLEYSGVIYGNRGYHFPL